MSMNKHDANYWLNMDFTETLLYFRNKDVNGMRLKIFRTDGEFDVMICKNKLDSTFSFVNLTKAHICTCKFNSIEDALKDLQAQEDVIKYEYVINKEI